MEFAHPTLADGIVSSRRFSVIAPTSCRSHVIAKRDELSWYTSQGLNDRGPDYFATSSVYYERFLTNPVKKHYPEMQRFFSDLLDENLGYEKVFDQSSSQPNPLLYPKEILFLDNRLVILKKSPT